MASDDHIIETQQRPPAMLGPLLGCHLLSLPWMLWMISLASLVVFRGVYTADLAEAIDVENVPLFGFFVDHYGAVYWGAMALGGLHLALGLLVYLDRLGVDPLRQAPATQVALRLSISIALILLASAIGCRYRSGDTSADLDLEGTNLLDWALVPLVALATRWVLMAITHADDHETYTTPTAARVAPASAVSRLGLIYLLGSAAVLVFAAEEHYRFWDKTLNGNYQYQQFFASDVEIEQAKFVFISTSLLFSSLAALAGCAGWVILRVAARTGNHADTTTGAAQRRGAILLAMLWTVVLMVPWQIKLRAEIVAERGWIMPLVTLLFTVAALTPMLLACRLMMQRDFDWCRWRKRGAANHSTVAAHGSIGSSPSQGDLALWTLLLFPVYPLLRPLRASPLEMLWMTLTAIAGMVVVQLSWLANHASQMFTFDDWRGMLKEAQFPFFQVICSLLVAWLVYSFIRLLRRGSGDFWRWLTAPQERAAHESPLRRGPFVCVAGLWLFTTLTLAAVWWFSLPTAHRTTLRQEHVSLLKTPFELWTLLSSDSLAERIIDVWQSGLRFSHVTGVVASLAMSLLIALLLYCFGTTVVNGLKYLAECFSVGPFAPSSLRVVERSGRVGSAAVVSLATVAVVLSATWPFWGWQNVNTNVFARAIEFNDRHAFELKFLHWVFDADRDGYAAVLHGADADDFDAQIQAGGMEPPRTTAVPIDEFEIADAERVAGAPNLVIFYLEGVVPRSISAYGQRQLPNGLVATPHIDSVAADGTLFRQARCHYPSTWDAWFAVNSGRFLYVKEMNTSEGEFEDRYSRYNNIYKVLNKCGVSRWCHGDVSPYRLLYVPPEMRGKGKPTDWKTETDDYNTALTDEQEQANHWRGDNRNRRMLEFIDDIKPGENFFICEHMTDTHFPWKRTERKRAIELGFPDGLEPYEADARLPSGSFYDQYARYYQTITRMDGQIGQILDKLKQRDLYDNTMIVIVSDHGCQWWEHEHQYYVEHLYEQTLHVPLIIKSPGLPRGVESDAPVQQIDVLPTVMEVAGVRLANPREDHPLIGRSLVPLMRGDHSPEVQKRYRERDIPLKTHYDTFGLFSQSRYKLIFERPTGTYLLFDLVEDPGEMHNLAGDRPELLKDMLQRLRQQIQKKPAFIGQIER